MGKAWANIVAFLRFLVSDRAVVAVYAERSPRRGANHRHWVSYTAAGVLLLVLVGFVGTMAWQRQDLDSYISGHSRIIVPQEGQAQWWVSAPMPKHCRSGDDCYRAMLAEGGLAEVREPSTLATLAGKVADGGRNMVLVRVRVPRAVWDSLRDVASSFVMAFPSFNYRRADVYVNGRHADTFLAGSRMTASFDASTAAQHSITADLAFEVDTDAYEFLEQAYNERLFIAPVTEYRAYLRFLMMDQASRGTWITDLTRIVMGLFVLILFLFIDGSSETLGLALFLGVEAVGLSIDFGWVPLVNKSFAMNATYAMGVVFRLYYVLHLARVVNHGLKPWLLGALAVSIPYGALRHFTWDFDVSWLDTFDIAQGLVLGSVSMAVCLRTALYLRGKNLPWRTWALVFAALGSMQQLLGPLGEMIPTLGASAVWDSFTNVWTPASTLLMATSAFINISTLENRVRTLSAAQAKSHVIEKELELARTVQQAHLELPALPPRFGIACHHEAELFVSGDSYFVHWDADARRFTVLLTDVTGHGIQAAMKASACQVIAKTIWQGGFRQGDDGARKSPFVVYEGMISGILSETNATHDVAALMGAEFDESTGRADLYRVNFTFPILITPRDVSPGEDGPLWDAKPLAVRNREVTSIALPPQSFLVILSDGFLSTSRDMANLVKYLRHELAVADAGLGAADVRAMILGAYCLKDIVTNDDRTLIVFQWQPKAEEARGSDPTRVLKAS